MEHWLVQEILFFGGIRGSSKCIPFYAWKLYSLCWRRPRSTISAFIEIPVIQGTLYLRKLQKKGLIHVLLNTFPLESSVQSYTVISIIWQMSRGPAHVAVSKSNILPVPGRPAHSLTTKPMRCFRLNVLTKSRVVGTLYASERLIIIKIITITWYMFTV